MSDSVKTPADKEICFKDHCMRITMWLALILGFAIICVGLPLVAFNM